MIWRWERKNSETALYESHREIESQDYNNIKRISRLIRFKEKIILCGELEVKNRTFQDSHTRTSPEIGELRRNCCEETYRVRQFLRMEKLFMRHERDPTIVVSYCLKFGTYRTKRIPFLRRRIFTILRQREVLEHPTFLVHPWRFRVPEQNIAAILDAAWYTPGDVFEGLPARQGQPSSYFRTFKEFGIFFSRKKTWSYRSYHTIGERNGTRATKFVNTHFDHTGGTYSHGGVVDSQRFSFSDMHLGKFPNFMNSKAGEVTSRVKYARKQPIIFSRCSGSKKLRQQSQLTNFWHRDRLWGE